eukprot:COSAG04_NODE_1466_length_6601_cov_4.336973_4_plen_245_part_00
MQQAAGNLAAGYRPAPDSQPAWGGGTSAPARMAAQSGASPSSPAASWRMDRGWMSDWMEQMSASPSFYTQVEALGLETADDMALLRPAELSELGNTLKPVARRKLLSIYTYPSLAFLGTRCGGTVPTVAHARVLTADTWSRRSRSSSRRRTPPSPSARERRARPLRSLRRSRPTAEAQQTADEQDQQAQNEVLQQVVAVGEAEEEKRSWEGCGCWSWSRLRWAARAHRLVGSRSRARLTSSRRR